MCITPGETWIERGPKWIPIKVPCKTCWRCKKNRVNDYVGRALCEASVSDWTLSLTLTYAPRDDLAEKILTPEHFQLFMKRLRKRGYKVRYLVAGEYGEQNGRAHFHVILFGMGAKPVGYSRPSRSGPLVEIPHERRFWLREWDHGHVFGNWNADDRALRYVCKYVLKEYHRQLWFSLSKKPMIGWRWFEKKADEAIEAGVMPSSFHYVPPGGAANKTYLMGRATKRRYLRRVTEGYRQRRNLDPLRLNKWVRDAVEALDYEDAVEAASRYTLDEQIAAYAEQLEMHAPIQHQKPARTKQARKEEWAAELADLERQYREISAGNLTAEQREAWGFTASRGNCSLGPRAVCPDETLTEREDHGQDKENRAQAHRTATIRSALQSDTSGVRGRAERSPVRGLGGRAGWPPQASRGAGDGSGKS